MIFNLIKLNPMERGRAEKHLALKVRYHGEAMTNREVYERFNPVARRVVYEAVERTVGYGIAGEPLKGIGEKAGYEILDADELILDIPKVLYKVCCLPERESRHYGLTV